MNNTTTMGPAGVPPKQNYMTKADPEVTLTETTTAGITITQTFTTEVVGETTRRKNVTMTNPKKNTPSVTITRIPESTSSEAAKLVKSDSTQHRKFDESSAMKRFSWVTIGDDKNVPLIFRNDESYVAVRMAEISILGELLNVLPVELYNGIGILRHCITPVEVNLLNNINSWHASYFYGSEPFTTEDTIISLKDLREFHDFLTFAFEVLHSGGQNFQQDFNHCGFLRVDNLPREGESKLEPFFIPYTLLKNGRKGVPLFYLDAHCATGVLGKAENLTGLSLAYLKLCCLVLRVRKEIIAGPALYIISIEDIKQVCPDSTLTENCWAPKWTFSLLQREAVEKVILSPLLRIASSTWSTLGPFVD